MRNPNRTTKRERRAIRRYNPYAARILGVAEAARWYREGVLLDEARGFDNILNDLKYGMVPLDLDDRVNAAIDGQRDRLERILGTIPGALKSTSSNVNHHGGTHTGYEVSAGPNPHITLKYPPHISLGAAGAPAADALAAAIKARQGGYGVDLTEPEAEPLGPSECGHYEVVDIRPNLNVIAMPESWFAKYEAYRKGREAGEEYADWDGDPWRDPNEVAAVHAEAIENALNDDIDPGD